MRNRILTFFPLFAIYLLLTVPESATTQTQQPELQSYSYIVNMPESPCNIFSISSPLAFKEIFITNIRIDDEIWWLFNSKDRPDDARVISWSYNDSLGTLTIRTPDSGITGIMRIDFSINLMENEQLESLTCHAQQLGKTASQAIVVNSELRNNTKK